MGPTCSWLSDHLLDKRVLTKLSNAGGGGEGDYGSDRDIIDTHLSIPISCCAIEEVDNNTGYLFCICGQC